MPTDKTFGPRDTPGASGYQIRAVIKTDDNQHRVRFDAADWFAAVPDGDVADLHAAGYQGDRADAVAYLVHERDAARSPIRTVFRYLETFQPRTLDGVIVGFEVTLNPADVYRWLTEHKPALAAGLFPGGPPKGRTC